MTLAYIFARKFNDKALLWNSWLRLYALYEHDDKT